jgi:hypothetical protein
MMRARYFVVGFVIAAFAFGALVLAAHAQTWFSVAREYLRYGYTLPANVERRTAIIDGETVSFLVLHVPTSMRWEFANDPTAPRSVHEWREDFGAELVVNGAYFTETNQPAGYYAIDGVQSGNATCPSFHDGERSIGYTFGVVLEHDRLDMVYLPDVPETFSFCTRETTGFASFPTIILNDVSMIETDSALRASRTVLAETVEGDQEIIVTESGEVTLYALAAWLLEQPETYELVGNLDGGPSTGISMKGERWDVEVPSAAVPNVIIGSR